MLLMLLGKQIQPMLMQISPCCYGNSWLFVEALIVGYTCLLDNKAQGRGFVGMSDSHRDIWLRNYLAKNYYM
jgi:hypothetical protein